MGEKNGYIEIESASLATDTFGEPVQTWSTFTSVWAEKLTPKSYERYTGQQQVGLKNTAWKIHYRTDVTNLMRISFESVTYRIVGVDDIGFHEFLLLTTEAIL